MVDDTFSSLNQNLISNQVLHSQIKYESPGATYSNENDSEGTKTNKSSAILNFMSKMLPSDEIAEDMSSRFVHTWLKIM